MEEIILLTNTTESECVNNSCVCSSKPILEGIKKYIYSTSDSEKKDNINELSNEKNDESNNIKIIEDAKKILNCDTESCVLNKLKSTDVLSKYIIDRELKTKFKVKGPRNTSELLNNHHIDDTLMLWAREFPHFYPCPFSMIDFEKTHNKFGTINLADLLNGSETYTDPEYGLKKGPFTSFGCVLNTDVSTGRGKHWICVFVDMRPKQMWTIEFFNSSGNAPISTITKWMERQRANLLPFHKVDTVPSTNILHQTDDFSCGSYALYYIRSRLDCIPYSYFLKNRIEDEQAVKFRTHLFRNN
jgi:hypothetical protein